MSKIESILNKYSKISTTEFTEKEIYAINKNPINKEFLSVLDYCKIFNKANNGQIDEINNFCNQNIMVNSEENNSSEISVDLKINKNDFNYPIFFTCFSKKICPMEMDNFINCQQYNRKNLKRCAGQRINLENCLSTRANYFVDNSVKICDI